MTNNSWRASLRHLGLLMTGAAAVLFILWKANPQELASSLGKASWSFLLASVAVLGCFYLLRALRWSIILRIRVPVGPLFLYSSVGYLASSIMPLQAGELLKPELLRRRHHIPFLEGLGSVGVERLLDVFCLVILGSISLLVLPPSLHRERWLTESLRTAGVFSSVGIIGLFLAVVISPRCGTLPSTILLRLPLPSAIRTRAINFIGCILQGATVLKTPVLFMLAILTTFLLWGVNYLSVLLVFCSVGTVVHPVTVLLGFAIVSLGVALPLTPAAIGQYEALWVLVFLALGVKPESSVVATGILSHGLILLVILLFGLISMLMLPRSMLRDAHDSAVSDEKVNCPS